MLGVFDKEKRSRGAGNGWMRVKIIGHQVRERELEARPQMDMKAEVRTFILF